MYKNEYFAGLYETYHNELSGNEELVSKANSVLSDTSTIIDRYNTLVNYVETSNWSGEAKDLVVTTSLPILKERFEMFKGNISNSLLPACETAVNDLLKNLEDMKQKETELIATLEYRDRLQREIEDTSRRLSSATNYETRDGKEVYTGRKDALQGAYDTLMREKAKIDNQINILRATLDSLKQNCDTAISNIRILSGAIELFSGTSVDSSFVPDIEGIENWKSTIYEKDGVYYQIPMRVTDNGIVTSLNPNYVICIDSNKIKDIIYNHYGDNVVQGDEYYNKVMSFLNDKLNDPKDDVLYDFRKNKWMSKDEKVLVSEIMNQILDDTYVCNDAKTIQQYAAMSSTVVTANALVKFGYGSNYTCETEGLTSVISDNMGEDGKFDCNTLVKWAYYQGFKKLNPETEMKFKDFTIDRIMEETIPLSQVNSENFESSDIGIGSVLTRGVPKQRGSLHIALVIGYGKDEFGNDTIVTAQSTSRVSGCVIVEYPKNELYSAWNFRENAVSSVSSADYYVNKMADFAGNIKTGKESVVASDRIEDLVVSTEKYASIN